MDIEKLISCVYHRRTLWDKNSKNYNNRAIAKRLWVEVSSEMEIPFEDIKKKWSNLRDQFRKEYTRLNKPGKSGAVANIITSSWSYYEPLLFLAKQIAPKPLHGDLTEIDSPDEELRHKDNTASSEFEETSSESPSLPVTSNSLPQNPFREPAKQGRRYASNQSGKLRKKRNLDVDHEYLEIEKRKLELFDSRCADKSAEDPDRNFLMSLLPHLKEVPRNRKLAVQRKLLDVFLEEESTPTKYSPK